MIHAQHLSYSLGGRTLLQPQTICVRPGELVAVAGANGAGKSTLLKLLSRDLAPTSGTIQLNRQALSAYPARDLAKCRAVLTQQNTLSFPFSIYELVMMGRYPHFDHQPTGQDLAVVDYVLHQTDLAHMTHRSVLSLSGGEQQRVFLARVMAQLIDYHELTHPESDSLMPKFLLLDEPTTGLDLYYQHALLQQARQLTRRGYGVVAILHDLNLVMQYADQVLLLHQGQSLAFGPPATALTPYTIRQAFGLDVQIIEQPALDYPIVIPITRQPHYQPLNA
ncbi:heme ABC transporter ATP-binding protein [Arsenicibacter rosenii]|uniref:ABC transporter domain-containing protein n=1 Tax=Arsenicibacter rosenii TaxID=1750698 RepID=A0A1S2VLJ0_9BACT|nr:heme ABC transporter ATP-binding protein [Arsenicibacter rosenii]OIN59622.1 hypothetical protein BLX24_07035 [Arsenicibacter rosenii]